MIVRTVSYRSRMWVICFLIMLVWNPVYAQNAGVNRYVLLIGGLGGSEEHTQKFQEYLFETRKAFIEQFQIPEENITLLGETSIESEDYVDAVSTSDNIQAAFTALKGKLGNSDQVFIILFGHGGYDNGEARLNIPRRDLNQNDYGSMVDGLSAARITFINTGSASAPFVEAISGPNRIVITATRTGTQKNETSFPRFMIEGFTNPSADQDKDGRISVGEVYRFAAEKTEQWFADNGNIPTENALLDDNGDQEGSRLQDLADGKDGHLANVTFFSSGAPALVAGATSGVVDSAWLQEKEQLEVEIAGLKSRKSEMNVDDYYAQLEVLFVKLARGNAAAERGQ